MSAAYGPSEALQLSRPSRHVTSTDSHLYTYHTNSNLCAKALNHYKNYILREQNGRCKVGTQKRQNQLGTLFRSMRAEHPKPVRMFWHVEFGLATVMKTCLFSASGLCKIQGYSMPSQ
eukprot:gnl/TRDRNA2_/TRDRNA2_84575_c0_seq1.p1 gnl/TRDRNA2_/TRDRNA2_84575_c0~~gnl/TRDRNA2_/TRDRNA2_84575_c0_seq1.p1  ORF type:complete len:118 (-),score=2.81 gnl/TRDRNA2_/TRDRNA2_84575_c0_seq1:78-431(-)